jgi:hypothetical protein
MNYRCSTSLYYCRSTYMLKICKYELLRYRFTWVRNSVIQLKSKIITMCILNWGLDRMFESKTVHHRITGSKERHDFWVNPSWKVTRNIGRRRCVGMRRVRAACEISCGSLVSSSCTIKLNIIRLSRPNLPLEICNNTQREPRNT